MTTLLLIRHGVTDITGKLLTGRLPGYGLNGAGRRQAQAVARRLSRDSIAALYASPIQRAQETAAFLSRETGTAAEVADAFTEVEFGAWSGLAIEELAGREEWKRFNARRGAARPPGGESVLDLQNRVVPELERLRRLHDGKTVAVISHGDPIRAALLFYLGMPADLIHRLEIGPASTSVVEVDDWSARVLGVNREP